MASKERLTRDFANMQKFSDSAEGITRLAFTEPDRQAAAYIKKRMKELGLTIHEDAFGNVVARREGVFKDEAPVMFGSHIDSVPTGGNFDGTAGVLAAIEAVEMMNEEGFRNECPIELVLFMCEESSRFGAATLGSRAMCGLLNVDDAKRLKDKQGITLYDALKNAGLNPDDLKSALYKGVPKAFFEMHIEQGKVLEAANKPIGIVTGIAAPTRMKIAFEGLADHSGATPMGMRKDALCAASEAILELERLASAETKIPVVGTVGVINIKPGAINVIPGTAEIMVDIRSISKDIKTAVTKKFTDFIKSLSEKRGIKTEITLLSDEKPVTLSDKAVKHLENICSDAGISYITMPSGAGHDAMHWAERTQTGMIFIPCKNGVSHNKDEYADINHIAIGADILCKAVKDVSAKDFRW